MKGLSFFHPAVSSFPACPSSSFPVAGPALLFIETNQVMRRDDSPAGIEATLHQREGLVAEGRDGGEAPEIDRRSFGWIAPIE